MSKTKKNATWREARRQFRDAMRLRMMGLKTHRERARLFIDITSDMQDAMTAAEVARLSTNARRLLIALPAECDNSAHGYFGSAWYEATGLDPMEFEKAFAELTQDEQTLYVNGSEGEGYWHMGLHGRLLSKRRAA